MRQLGEQLAQVVALFSCCVVSQKSGGPGNIAYFISLTAYGKKGRVE